MSAQTETCVLGSQVTVCVQWNAATAPIQSQNFRVTFPNALNPTVELLTGDMGWVVYAYVNSTHEPANIASISTPAADNFVVRIGNPEGDPGAANVGEILLQPTSAGNYANLAGGEITGDLTGGLVLQRSAGGSGGVLTGLLQVHGAIGGTVDIPVIDGTFGGWLQVLGGADSNSTIVVSERLVNGGQISIYGDVPDTATVVINDLRDESAAEIALEGTLNGLLILSNGVPDESRVVVRRLGSTGVIDLDGGDIEGALLMPYGGAGAILDGGDVRGVVTLAAFFHAGPPTEFSGTPAFGSVVGSELADADLSTWGLLSGSITLSGNIGPYGFVTVLNDVGPLASIEAGDLLANSTIWVGDALRGRVVLRGDMLDGFIDVGDGVLDYARLVIDGSLADGCQIVVGDVGVQAAIVVDYDGWDADDVWESGATVQVGAGDPLVGNTPAARVWEIQPCRGDMNNDGLVNAFDIDPFILALSDVAGYEEAFPGLEGSRGYHGDCNCSDAFNNFDIDPFVARVIANECSATCGDSLAGGGEGSRGDSAEPPTAADVAALLREYTATHHHAALLAVVATAADRDDAAIAAFWSDVLALLMD